MPSRRPSRRKQKISKFYFCFHWKYEVLLTGFARASSRVLLTALWILRLMVKPFLFSIVYKFEPSQNVYFRWIIEYSSIVCHNYRKEKNIICEYFTIWLVGNLWILGKPNTSKYYSRFWTIKLFEANIHVS